ncbi:hypothetical protein DA73_0400007015 [Tolypothrix bouteillei VB521301]|uniref:Isopropylmalate/homocitrate/citramalate synthase n=4 Tax=Nostocales TaxID=1161 RepID=A0A8S9THI8_9CYAN|nr:hypothetical protein DA73_0400007015 [Tolypothrix bouteillei VB521301]
MDMKSDFLYPHKAYHGVTTPENLKFDAMLQYFTQRVDYIVGLETNGKLPSVEAFEKIQSLWEQLDNLKKELGIGKSSSNGDQK